MMTVQIPIDTTTLGDTDTGTVVKNVYGNASANNSIALITGIHPRETLSIDPEIKAAKEKLTESAQKVFTKMYEQAAQAQGAQAGPNPGAGPAPEGFNGDDVVDGDYKEI